MSGHLLVVQNASFLSELKAANRSLVACSPRGVGGRRTWVLNCSPPPGPQRNAEVSAFCYLLTELTVTISQVAILCRPTSGSWRGVAEPGGGGAYVHPSRALNEAFRCPADQAPGSGIGDPDDG